MKRKFSDQEGMLEEKVIAWGKHKELVLNVPSLAIIDIRGKEIVVN